MTKKKSEFKAPTYPERDIAAQLANFDGRISIGRAFPYGIQHVLAMFVANLAPIAIIAAAAVSMT